METYTLELSKEELRLVNELLGALDTDLAKKLGINLGKNDSCKECDSAHSKTEKLLYA